jgi:hypothetical protein
VRFVNLHEFYKKSDLDRKDNSQRSIQQNTLVVNKRRAEPIESEVPGVIYRNEPEDISSKVSIAAVVEVEEDRFETKESYPETLSSEARSSVGLYLSDDNNVSLGNAFSADRNLQASSWLLGEWRSTNAPSRSYEIWEGNDSNIIGRTYLSTGGKPVLTEQVNINLHDSSAVLTLETTEKTEIINLDLKEQSPSVLLLLEKNTSNPRVLTLQNMKDGTMQNALIQQNKNFDQKFMQNVRQRSFIDNSNAVRNMKKTN